MASGIVANIRMVKSAQLLLLVRDAALPLVMHAKLMEPPEKAVELLVVRSRFASLMGLRPRFCKEPRVSQKRFTYEVEAPHVRGCVTQSFEIETVFSLEAATVNEIFRLQKRFCPNREMETGFIWRAAESLLKTGGFASGGGAEGSKGLDR
jgi:hypothetical protein